MDLSSSTDKIEKEPLRYRIHASRGTAYIWLPDTTIGIAPSFEEWEEIKQQVDRRILHERHAERIRNANLSTRDSSATA